jgi:hypothetical protein
MFWLHMRPNAKTEVDVILRRLPMRISEYSILAIHIGIFQYRPHLVQHGAECRRAYLRLAQIAPVSWA